jgi:hypothetical protein
MTCARGETPAALLNSPITTEYYPNVFIGQALTPGFVSGMQVVVTFIQLINTSSGSGDSCVVASFSGNCSVHSGVAGSGSYDRFPLQCEFGMEQADHLVASVVVGKWDVVVTSHYAPNPVWF